MGAFLVFCSFGFYPVAGESVYLLATPLFPSIAITDPETKTTARIKTVNFDGGKENIYIISATLNGEPFTRNWFTHDELFGVGGTLELTLGPVPSEWGTAKEDRPPSLSEGGRFTGTMTDFL
jgi:putative alpha-1,2-mannosidase